MSAPGTRSASSRPAADRKSTRLNSSHSQISYAVFCLKKKNTPAHTFGRARRRPLILVANYPTRCYMILVEHSTMRSVPRSHYTQYVCHLLTHYMSLTS